MTARLNLSLIVRLLRAEISETERMTFTSRFPKIHSQVCNQKLPMKPTNKFFFNFSRANYCSLFTLRPLFTLKSCLSKVHMICLTVSLMFARLVYTYMSVIS